MTNMFDAMKKYAGKAVQSREQYYAGEREATADYNNGTPGSPYATASSAEDARYQWEQSRKGKSLIADNRWHMMQAVMFGVMSMATNIAQIASDLRKIRQMMEVNGR